MNEETNAANAVVENAIAIKAKAASDYSLWTVTRTLSLEGSIRLVKQIITDAVVGASEEQIVKLIDYYFIGLDAQYEEAGKLANDNPQKQWIEAAKGRMTDILDMYVLLGKLDIEAKGKRFQAWRPGLVLKIVSLLEQLVDQTCALEDAWTRLIDDEYESIGHGKTTGFLEKAVREELHSIKPDMAIRLIKSLERVRVHPFRAQANFRDRMILFLTAGMLKSTSPGMPPNRNAQLAKIVYSLLNVDPSALDMIVDHSASIAKLSQNGEELVRLIRMECSLDISDVFYTCSMDRIDVIGNIKFVTLYQNTSKPKRKEMREAVLTRIGEAVQRWRHETKCGSCVGLTAYDPSLTADEGTETVKEY